MKKYLFLVAFAFVAVSLFFGSTMLPPPPEDIAESLCESLYDDLQLYAEKNNGKYPKNIISLTEIGVSQNYIDKLAKNNKDKLRYPLEAIGTFSEDDRMIFKYEFENVGTLVCFNDGKMKWLSVVPGKKSSE